MKFRQASDCCKKVLKAVKLDYTNKTKKSIISPKVGLGDFWRIANRVLNTGESALHYLLNGAEVFLQHLKNFSMNSNLDDTGMSLPTFLSRTNVKQHNIPRTTKKRLIKKVTTNLDSSKASGPDCIPVVVLKNCEPELSYILTQLFNMCLKESCFPDCWKASSVVPVFKNVGKRYTAKNYHTVSIFSVKTYK